MIQIKTIQFKRGTNEALTRVLVGDKKPLQGEPIFELDTNRFKIGNGIDDYATLPYLSGGSGGGQEVIVVGYYDPTTNIFWKEQTKVTPFPKDNSKVYLDLITSQIYYVDTYSSTYRLLAAKATENTPGFVRLYSDEGQAVDGAITQKLFTTTAESINESLTLLKQQSGNYLRLIADNNALVLKLFSKLGLELSSVRFPNELPDYHSVMNKYLFVDEKGNLTWKVAESPSSKEYYAGVAIQIDADNTINVVYDSTLKIDQNGKLTVNTDAIATLEALTQLRRDLTIEINKKQSKLTSSGLHAYVHNGSVQGELAFDNTPSVGSNNLVTSGVIKAALDEKYTKPGSGIPSEDLKERYYLASNPNGFIDKSVIDLENYTRTDNLGELALKDTLASTELSDASDVVRHEDIVTTTTSTAEDKVLAANVGAILQGEINDLKAIGRYLSGWNCVTGLPTTDPQVPIYTYQTGDYYIVVNVASEVSENNYRPAGSQYTRDEPSRVRETQTVKVNDYYRYDGIRWQLEINTQRTTTFASIEGNPEDNINLLNSLDAKADDSDVHYTNMNGTTIAVGGIPKGTTFNNKSLKDMLQDLLYPYVSATLSSVTATPAAKTYEYGSSKSLTTIIPIFTKGSENELGIMIGTTPWGYDLYSASSVVSGESITLPNPYQMDGLQDKNIYCTISDGQTSDTKIITFTFSKYYYYAVSNSTTIPTQAVSNGISNEKDGLTTLDNTYIWWLSPSSKSKIQQYSMSQWNDLTTVYAGTTTFHTAAGQDITYYAYRTDKMNAATGYYRLI